MTELAVTDGMPPPGDLPRGECYITRFLDDHGQPAGIRIDRADPRILISAELMDSMAHGESPWAVVEPPPGGCDLTYRGALLKISAVNQRVIYRITDYVPRVNAMIAEWPD